MKWFKHLSGSLKDSVIFEAVELFGSDAYLVFFGTLELMSDEFDAHNPGVNRISLKKMSSLFQISRHKVVKILQHFGGNLTEISRKSDENIGDSSGNSNYLCNKKALFFVQVEKDYVIVTCNKLAMLCDNHTQKLLRDTSKLLQSENELTSIQEEEVEVEEDKRIKKPPISPNGGFDLFWDSYPKKKKIGDAKKAWLKLKPNKDLLETILKAVGSQKMSVGWQKDNGDFIPYPATWLRSESWLDEIKEGEKKLW